MNSARILEAMDDELKRAARIERIARAVEMPSFAEFGDVIASDRPTDEAWIWFWSDVYDGRVRRAFPRFWEMARSRRPHGTVREVIDAWPPDELKAYGSTSSMDGDSEHRSRLTGDIAEHLATSAPRPLV